MNTYLWAPAPQPALPVRGRNELLPVHRVFCIGRNYQAHAIEMGGTTVDKAATRPMYFTKSAHALLRSGEPLPYPPMTQDFHHEVELVVALGAGGFEVPVAEAARLIYGYACGLDMTRRDLQQYARERGQPWSVSKDVEGSAVCTEIVPMPGVVLAQGGIALNVNGEVRQRADLSHMIWTVPEIIADLSRYYHLQPGDLIYTGTPEGVGPVQVGDRLHGQIDGVGALNVTVVAF